MAFWDVIVGRRDAVSQLLVYISQSLSATAFS
jgi:hypothetical protein